MITCIIHAINRVLCKENVEINPIQQKKASVEELISEVILLNK